MYGYYMNILNIYKQEGNVKYIYINKFTFFLTSNFFSFTLAVKIHKCV